MTNVAVDSVDSIDGEYILFQCPHCDDTIIVKLTELNCRIFRHGVFKDTYQQVDPHLSQEMCNDLKNCDKIFGCCKPFRINLTNLQVEICDYI